MSDQDIHNNVDEAENQSRRRFLTGITAGFGAVGAAAAATPFVLTMSPSERAKNAGAPAQYDYNLADPDSLASVQPVYAQNQARADANNPEVLVMLGVCTHLGCSPVEKLAIGPDPQMGDDNQGGFFCPCHGSKFDLSGRVYKKVPAVLNMEIPPYAFEGNVITIGEDGGRTA